LGDFNAKVGREDIFKRTVGNERPHEISNDDGVRAVIFATSRNLIVKCTTFPHRSIHKYKWTSPEGQMHSQVDRVLTDRRRHSSILHVRYFRGADCDSDNYLVVEEVREILAVSKRMVNKMEVERFNLKQLNEEEVKEQYQVTIHRKMDMRFGKWNVRSLYRSGSFKAISYL
jgi:hypothetical protein